MMVSRKNLNVNDLTVPNLKFKVVDSFRYPQVIINDKINTH